MVCVKRAGGVSCMYVALWVFYVDFMKYECNGYPKVD